MAVSAPAQALVARASTTTTYTATETIPVPPASNYAGAGGGDGWAVVLSNTQVFNIFHHNGVTQLSCHNQSDASACYPVRTITDGSGNNFATSGHPGMFLDQNTGKLYTYGSRGSDSTAGVICIDTTLAATNPNPFCGYTALTAVNDGPLSSGISGLSTPMQVGTKWYAFNFVNGTAAGAGAGAQNTLLCFDLTTFAACGGQPIPVNIGAGTVGVNSFPTPATASIGTQIVIPIITGGNPLLACWDASTGTNCSGSWPAAAPITYPGNAGGPFAELDPTGKLIGLCLPTGTDECYSVMGASVATPPGMTAAIGSGSASWDGTGLVLGPRVYVPAWNNVVYCYDSSTSASCANFPKFFNNLSLLYTVNPDPRRPTCIWVNADSGSAQIQNFDAYTGGACGSGPIRVLASSIVVPTQLCTPFTYTSLQVLSPTPSAYTSGTVAFEDPDANPIPGTPVLTLDATGTASLTGLNLNTVLGLPQFLITLTGASSIPTSVTVQLTWTGVADPSCVPAGAPSPYSLIAYPIQAVVGKPFNGANGGSNVVGAITVQATSSGTAAPSSAQVVWGDGTSSAGSIQLGPTSASESVFYVQGKHTFASPISNGTITVTAVVGKTNLTATAPLEVLPDKPQAFFVVNPGIGTQNQVSLLIPVAQGPGQQQIIGYDWTSTADTSHPIFDTPALRPLYACVINALILSGGSDGSGTCQGGQFISSFIQGAIQLGILPDTTYNFIGGLTSPDILTIAQLWSQYYPQHIIPYVFPFFSEVQTSHVAFSLAIGVPGANTLPSCLGVDSAVCWTVPNVTVEPDCALVTAIFGFSSTCDLGAFTPRTPDYVGVNVTAQAGELVFAQGGISLVLSRAILDSPSSDDIFLQFSVGAGFGVATPVSVEDTATTGWVNGPFSSTPDDSHINAFVDHCTISGGGGLGISVGPVSLGGGALGVSSPGGDPGFTTGFETFINRIGVGASAIAGVSVNYALSLSQLGVPLSNSDLNTLKDVFNGVTS